MFKRENGAVTGSIVWADVPDDAEVNQPRPEELAADITDRAPEAEDGDDEDKAAKSPAKSSAKSAGAASVTTTDTGGAKAPAGAGKDGAK